MVNQSSIAVKGMLRNLFWIIPHLIRAFSMANIKMNRICDDFSIIRCMIILETTIVSSSKFFHVCLLKIGLTLDVLAHPSRSAK